VPFEFEPTQAVEINSLLDGNNDTLVASSLLMEGLLIDQDIPEDTSSLVASSPSTKRGKSPRGGKIDSSRSDAYNSNSPSPILDSLTIQVVPPITPTVVVASEVQPEKPSGPKPFSWADITKTTSSPTPVVVSTPTPVSPIISTSTPVVTNNNSSNNTNNNNNNNNNNHNNTSNNNSNNNSNNKNNKINNNKANANHNANVNNPNNKAHMNNNKTTNNSNNSNQNNANNTTSTNNNSNSNKSSNDDKTKKPLPVIDNLDLSTINSPDFNCNPTFAKFFVIKSYSEDDIHKSIKYGIWTSTESGNKRLDRGYRECAGKGPVYLFFSVNSSGQFCGLAEMTSPLDYSKKASCWNEDKWSGQFTVSWKIIKDIQNIHLRHIKLVNNENKPVTNSRDTQEVFFQPGLEVLQIFHRFQSKNSILDDFSYYNQCEKESKGQTVK